MCHASLTSVSDRTKNCEAFENNLVLLYSEARNGFLWQDQNRRADKPLIFGYSPLGPFSDWKPFRWAPGRSTGICGGWNDGMVVSSLLVTSCSFKFVSVLLSNGWMWFSTETECVFLDTSVFHWLSTITFKYCLAIDDVPVATWCLLTGQNMENEGLKWTTVAAQIYQGKYSRQIA